MRDNKRLEEIESLSPEVLEAQRKQRSLNRIFGFFVAIALILFIFLVWEIILLFK